MALHRSRAKLRPPIRGTTSPHAAMSRTAHLRSGGPAHVRVRTASSRPRTRERVVPTGKQGLALVLAHARLVVGALSPGIAHIGDRPRPQPHSRKTGGTTRRRP